MQYNLGYGDAYQWYVPTPNDQRRSAKGKQRQTYTRRIRPPYTYTELISQAIMASSERALTLRQIVTCLENRYPCFRGPYRGWRNSIRHNLSANECFQKVLRDSSKPNGKDNYWTMNENCKHCLEKSCLSSSTTLKPLRKRNTFDDVMTSKRTNQELEPNNNTLPDENNAEEAFVLQQVVDTEPKVDQQSAVIKPIDLSQSYMDTIEIREPTCPENASVPTNGHPSSDNLTDWQEMTAFSVDKFEYSSDSNIPPRQMFETQNQYQLPRAYVQHNQRPFPVHLATSQGYPVPHDTLRNGYYAPPYNMMDQNMYFYNLNQNQQQYSKMNNGNHRGAGSQIAEQVHTMNGRVHQESMVYQQL